MGDESLSRLVAVTEAAGGSSAALLAAAARAATPATSGAAACSVILVEGMSDQAALLALAARAGRDLAAEHVFVVPMGGATNIGHFLDLFGPQGFGVRLAGLCDAGEEHDFARGLERAGLTPASAPPALTPVSAPPARTRAVPDRPALERLGFFVCETDLEDELIRSLGVARTEQLIEAEGELTSFRTFTRQPAQRTRTRHQQLRRFMGTRSGRKIRYGQVLADALDLTQVPRPLAAVLAHA